ncbi:methyltransferase [bacterium]|nr:methyltransferase [bacterium]
MADFIRLKDKESFIEIGSGVGCLSFIIFDRYPNFKRAMLVEIQTEVFNVLKRNIEENELQDKVILVNSDARNLPSLFPHLANSFDIVFTNPPHIKRGRGRISPSESKVISTTETLLTLDDIGRISSYFLKIRGRLYIIHRSERLKEIISNLDNFGLEVKRITFVYTSQTKPSKRVLIEARKGGRPGVIVEPPIFL